MTKHQSALCYGAASIPWCALTDLPLDTPYTAAARPGAVAGWLVLPLMAEAALAAAVLAIFGANDGGIHAALLATARLAFLLFLPAYIGGALVTLFGPAFENIGRYARELGLAFAAALAVHLGLVAWLCALGDVPPVRTFVIFGIGAICVYGLALFSIGHVQRRLGARAWSILRFLAMNYIAAIFAEDFLRVAPVADGRYALVYLPFATLAIVGPGLRLAAFIKSWMPRTALR